MENNIVPEASKYTACSLKVSGTVSSKEAEEVWHPASFLEQDPDPMGCARHICIKKQGLYPRYFINILIKTSMMITT